MASHFFGVFHLELRLLLIHNGTWNEYPDPPNPHDRSTLRAPETYPYFYSTENNQVKTGFHADACLKTSSDNIFSPSWFLPPYPSGGPSRMISPRLSTASRNLEAKATRHFFQKEQGSEWSFALPKVSIEVTRDLSLLPLSRLEICLSPLWRRVTTHGRQQTAPSWLRLPRIHPPNRFRFIDFFLTFFSLSFWSIRRFEPHATISKAPRGIDLAGRISFLSCVSALLLSSAPFSRRAWPLDRLRRSFRSFWDHFVLCLFRPHFANVLMHLRIPLPPGYAIAFSFLYPLVVVFFFHFR